MSATVYPFTADVHVDAGKTYWVIVSAFVAQADCLLLSGGPEVTPYYQSVNWTSGPWSTGDLAGGASGMASPMIRFHTECG